MDFHQSFQKCSIFTPDIRKQPHISLESVKWHIKIKWSIATRGSYVHISLWENSRGIPIILVLCNFLRKWMVFEQKDSQGFENSYNSYEQYPLEKFFIFTFYQNYTLALIVKQATTPSPICTPATCRSQMTKPLKIEGKAKAMPRSTHNTQIAGWFIPWWALSWNKSPLHSLPFISSALVTAFHFHSLDFVHSEGAHVTHGRRDDLFND